MSVEELHKLLELAQRQAAKREGSIQQRIAAYDAVSAAQRNLAAAQGLDYAVPLEVGWLPEAAVSNPVLFQTDYDAFLTFNAVQTSVEGRRHKAGTAVAEIRRCSITQFGYPNDEALPGHPLYSRGLSAYGIFEVRNSLWVRQITERNRVSFPNAPDSKKKHYIICFHDSSFECIADALKITVTDRPYAEIFASLSASSIHQAAANV